MRAAPGAIQRDVTPLGAIVLRVLCAVLALGVLGGMAYLQTFPPMATVMSQSMEPTIKMGDVVLFKSLRGAQPKVGDVVEIRVPAAERQKHS
jgi:signal peptidase I